MKTVKDETEERNSWITFIPILIIFIGFLTYMFLNNRKQKTIDHKKFNASDIVIQNYNNNDTDTITLIIPELGESTNVGFGEPELRLYFKENLTNAELDSLKILSYNKGYSFYKNAVQILGPYKYIKML